MSSLRLWFQCFDAVGWVAGRASSSAFFCKRIFSGTHILIFDWRPPFGILDNHKIKMCHNLVKKNNDTKDYSEQLEFLNSEPYYVSKKIVNQSSDFLVRRTGSYRHKKHWLSYRCRQQARPSTTTTTTSIDDNAIDLPWRKFSKSGVWDKVPQGSTLILGVTLIFFTILRPVLSIGHRLVTDRRTDKAHDDN